jgi:uncharacterized protein (UPF0335 family)
VHGLGGNFMQTLLEKQSPLDVTSPAPWTTEKYHFLPTKDVIREIEGRGWEMKEIKYNKTLNNPFQKHLIAFEQSNGFKSVPRRFENLGIKPRIYFYNSHDARSSAKVHYGMYRFACANGIILGADIQSQKCPHTFETIKDWTREVMDRLEAEQEYADKIIQVADEMTATESFKFQIAKRVVDLREYNLDKLRINATDLLLPTRQEDERESVWNVFNVAQERAIQGFKHYKAISDPKRLLSINLHLWNSMENEVGQFIQSN